MGVEIDMTGTGRAINSSDESSENLSNEYENLNRSVLDIAGINMQEENPIKSNRSLVNLENINIQENKPLNPREIAEMRGTSPVHEHLEMLKSKKSEGDAEMRGTSPANERLEMLRSKKSEGDAEMKETSPANERLEMLRSKLEILFEYEKRHLDLLKEYKEEIKFANALQEDLRREKSNFFTQILGEVSESLKKVQVEPSVAAKWLQELVESYTKSLNVSVDLAKICVVEIIGKLREESKENLENIQRESLENEAKSD
ncbi:MAG: hypothetical protein BWK80_55110 [Desulfobacteraceae bacterium IS3]|nr:MAG: hypothetical protein BWK80_55110 [Desulfobacteraceae bacterium IS3]